MIKILCSIIIAMTGFSVMAQITNQTSDGGDGEDYPVSMVIGSDGGIFVLAASSSNQQTGTMDVTALGSNYFWLIKYNADYSIAWQKSYGGDMMEIPSVILDVQNGLLLGGDSNSADNTGNKSAPNYGGSDMWLLKIDYEGEIIWQQSYGGSDHEGIRDILLLPNNEFLLCGGSRSNISGIKTEDNYGDLDIWLIKVDENGQVIWDKTIGSEGTERFYHALLLQNGNVVLVSHSNDWTGTGLKSEPNNSPWEDVWMVCMDQDGEIIWDKVFGGDSFERHSCAVSDENHIYLFTESGSDPSGTRTATRKGFYDVWMVKMDFNSNIVFDRSFGGEYGETPYSAFLAGDRIFVASDSPSGISFDKTEPSNGDFDYWPLSISLDGNLIAEKTIGGSLDDVMQQVLPIQNDKVLILGYSRSPVSGDKTTPNYGEGDVWLVEVDAATLSLPDLNNIVLDVYPNPCTDVLHVQIPDNSQIKRMEINDVSGKIVWRSEVKSFSNATISIPTAELKSGVYSLNVIGEGFSKVTRFVKE